MEAMGFDHEGAKARAETERPLTAEELCTDEHIQHYGDDDAMDWAIATTIARLPRAVQNFACARLRFVSLGHHWRGMTLPAGSLTRLDLARSVDDDIAAAPDEKDWVIVLDSAILAVASEDAASTIAHEIAHAWLGHDCRVTSADLWELLEHKAAARQQARHWGFTGHGAREEAAADDTQHA